MQRIFNHRTGGTSQERRRALASPQPVDSTACVPASLRGWELAEFYASDSGPFACKLLREPGHLLLLQAALARHTA